MIVKTQDSSIAKVRFQLAYGYVGWHLWEADAHWEDGCGEQRGVEQPGPGVPVQQVAQVYPLDGTRPQGDVQDGDLQNEYKWLFVR